MKEKLFKFFDAIPVLLSLKNPERWSWLIKAIFTEEQETISSVFAMNPNDKKDPNNRLDQAFSFVAYVPNRLYGLYGYLRRLCLIAMLTHYRKEHGATEYDEKYKDEIEFARQEEEIYPEVAQYMTVDEVTEFNFWDE